MPVIITSFMLKIISILFNIISVLIGLSTAPKYFCWHKTQSRAMVQSGMVKKNMKKIEFKKIVTTALIAVMGLFALVAMKPMRENFPAVGIMGNPPVIEHGCPLCPVYTIKNNSSCDKLKVVVGFKASQTNSAGDIITSEVFPILPIFYAGPVPPTILTTSDISPFVTPPINTNQDYSLTWGGIDIYASDYTTIIGNVKPGETKRISKKDANGNELTGICDCYIVTWNEATKTITIDDCQ